MKIYLNLHFIKCKLFCTLHFTQRIIAVRKSLVEVYEHVYKLRSTIWASRSVKKQSDSIKEENIEGTQSGKYIFNSFLERFNSRIIMLSSLNIAMVKYKSVNI